MGCVSRNYEANLSEQVKGRFRYEETYLEVETDPDTLPEGEPVITAYCGLAEQFNLLAL